jgi:hypothetical protein
MTEIELKELKELVKKHMAESKEQYDYRNALHHLKRLATKLARQTPASGQKIHDCYANKLNDILDGRYKSEFDVVDFDQYYDSPFGMGSKKLTKKEREK